MPDAFKFDPLMLLRESLNRLEGGLNAYATEKMASEQFARTLARLMKVSLAGQHVFARTLAGLYVRLDLPSRSELAALAAAVQRIEDKVDALLPPAPSLAPRPARTRRAPAPPPPPPVLAPEPGPKAARRVSKPASATPAAKADETPPVTQPAADATPRPARASKRAAA